MSVGKFNKKTFLVVVLVALLCFLSITGATYALFTSTLEDGKIGVNATSGNIEVDVVDTTKEENSLLGDALRFFTTSNKQEILFEPGALYYTEGFRVKNTGDIALNYILYISADESITSDFFDAFEVWLTNDPSSRNMQRIEDFEGSLAVGHCSETFHLVFRMKPDAGNEFQNRLFQNKEIRGVGITVCAVQGNAGMPEAGDDHVDIEQENT